MKAPNFLAVLFLLVSGAALNGEPKPGVFSGDVMEWVKADPQKSHGATPSIPLQPEWIGTVKPVVLHDPDKIHDKEKDEALRINRIQRDAKGRVVIARVSKDSLMSASAVFKRELPSIKELESVTKLSQLTTWFGPQHGWTDGWGGLDEMHWTEGWTWFTTAEKDRLRWLSVFAHVSGPAKKPEQAKVDILIVREGFLRRADPASAKEKAEFPSADELEDADEREREAERTKLPRPLRDLVAAREKRGDHDLRAYTEFINGVRANPQPALFEQLAARSDDGTCEIQGMVDNILMDDFPLQRKPWAKDKKRSAMKHMLNAISQVPDRSSLEKWTAQMLAALGGGKIESAGVEVKKDSQIYGQGSHDADDLKSLKAAVRSEFEGKFPELR